MRFCMSERSLMLGQFRSACYSEGGWFTILGFFVLVLDFGVFLFGLGSVFVLLTWTVRFINT